jgi:putative intracellular protease/amidase
MRSLNLAPFLALITSAHARPTQPEFSNTTTLPIHYGVMVFPHFQALDVFGPMDVFNTLAMMYSNSTKMRLSVLSTTMEPVFTGMTGPNAFGQKIVPTTTYADYLAQSAKGFGSGEDDKGELEVLLVPGGGGTRQPLTEEIAFVKTMYPKVTSLIFIYD